MVVFEIVQCLKSSIVRMEVLISTKEVRCVFVTFEVHTAVLLC